MKRLYGNIKMTWLKVVLFAVIAGVYTGFVMLVPFLNGTSFRDIGTYTEWWLIFAVIVVVNCKKGTEAMLKCFVFFLISQPLVYIVEMVFGSLSFELAWYYYSRIWLPATFLTLPGGFIAYQCKRQDALGGIVLGLGNAIQLFYAVFYFKQAIENFPHHLLSGIVCVASVIIMTLCIHKEKRNRLLAFLIPVVLAALLFVFAQASGRVI